jgi:hypothetical protein
VDSRSNLSRVSAPRVPLERARDAATSVARAFNHRPARIGALATSCDAIFHAADSLAVFGTRGADLRTCATQDKMPLGPPHHEVRRHTANLGAVRHEFQMRRLDVRAAQLQAMLIEHVLAYFVTMSAGFDALRQFVIRNAER